MRYYTVMIMIGLLGIGFIFLPCPTKNPKMKEYGELNPANILAEIEYIREGK